MVTRPTWRNNIVMSIIMVGGIALACPVHAFFDAPVDELLEESNITLEEAVSTSLREIPGKAYEVELEREDGRVAFEVKIQDHNGQEQEVYIDAVTGNVLSTEKHGE